MGRDISRTCRPLSVVAESPSMQWYAVIVTALSLINGALCVFPDEAYSVDYQHTLLGLPQPHTTFFHKPQLSSNASLLYTLSDKAVLGAVNPRDGSLVWRSSILDQPSHIPADAFLVIGDADGQLVTAFQERVAAIEASTGKEIWVSNVPATSRVVGLELVPSGDAENAVQDVVVLREQDASMTVSRLSGHDGSDKWSYGSAGASINGESFIAVSSNHAYHVSRSAGVVSGSKIKVEMIDSATGKSERTYSIDAGSTTVTSTGSLIAGAGSDYPFIVAADASYQSLTVNLLGKVKSSSVAVDTQGDSIQSIRVHAPDRQKASPHFLVHVVGQTKQWAEVFHLDTATGEVTRIYKLPASTGRSSYAASSNANHVYFTKVTETDVSVYGSSNQKPLSSWPRRHIGFSVSASTAPIFIAAEVARGTNIAVRVAVLSPEGSWYLIRNGDSQWWRPEMLAYTTLATFSNEVIADALIQELETEVRVDPATAYINRLYRHTKELTRIPRYLLSLPQKLLNPVDDEISTRQKLVGARSVIVATSKNYVLSVDASTGEPRWNTDLTHKLQEGSEVLKYISTDDSRVTLYTNIGSVIVLDVGSGDLLDYKKGTVPVERLIEIPGSPAKTVVKVAANGTPEVASDLAPSGPDEGNTIVTLSSTGEAIGWTVGSSVRKLWSFAPSDGSKVVDVSGRAMHDPVASIGRVLGDRSVMYKYISPNVVLLTATSATTLTVYLLDAITGTLLYTDHQRGVLTTLPHPAILSENWFAYSFSTAHSKHGMIHNLIISELFESSSPNDRVTDSTNTTYSSFSAGGVNLPYVESAAYTVSEPLTSFSVTATSQGITTRELLAYLASSKSIIGIPRNILSASRPVDRDPSQSEAEEGLFRYQPDLVLSPNLYLSHAREVLGIKQILTSPTLLESTSMVFAFGHDVFGTQTAPSQTFDVLGKNFSKVQLSLTVVALYLGVLVMRPIVRRKTVERSWM